MLFRPQIAASIALVIVAGCDSSRPSSAGANRPSRQPDAAAPDGNLVNGPYEDYDDDQGSFEDDTRGDAGGGEWDSGVCSLDLLHFCAPSSVADASATQASAQANSSGTASCFGPAPLREACLPDVCEAWCKSGERCGPDVCSAPLCADEHCLEECASQLARETLFGCVEPLGRWFACLEQTDCDDRRAIPWFTTRPLDAGVPDDCLAEAAAVDCGFLP